MKKLMKFMLSIVAIISLNSCFGMEYEVVQTDTLLKIKIPATIKNKPVVYLAPLLTQEDDFSCGYRSIFHAIALDSALQSKNFIKTLESKLHDTNLLNEVFNFHGIEDGLFDNQIADIADSYNLKNISFLCLDQKDISFINSGDLVLKDKPNSKKLSKLVINKIKKCLTGPSTAAHFICNPGGHWMLMSVVKNKKNQIKLYIIDSHIKPLSDRNMIFANFLLEQINKI